MSARLDATKADILRKVKNLGFPTPYQLFLYESAIGFHWVGYGGMGTSIDRLASPDETEAALSLLGSGIFVRLDASTLLNDGLRAYRIILKVDISPADTLRTEMPNHGPFQNFLKKWQSRQRASSDFRGLVHQDLSRNPYQKQPYTWVYYAGMGEVRYEDVAAEDVTVIEQMIAAGLIVRGKTYERELINNGMERVTDLTLRA
ncbi:MAG: hypothetical protein GC134_00395 [Proteobacteria bacterium]|nr:hypothetical protein [Pseudomonadota bacterium]